MISTCTAVSRSRDRRPQARVPQAAAGRSCRTLCKVVWMVWATGTSVLTMTGRGCRGGSSQLRFSAAKLVCKHAGWRGEHITRWETQRQLPGAQDAAGCLCAAQTVTVKAAKGGCNVFWHALPWPACSCRHCGAKQPRCSLIEAATVCNILSQAVQPSHVCAQRCTAPPGPLGL